MQVWVVQQAEHEYEPIMGVFYSEVDARSRYPDVHLFTETFQTGEYFMTPFDLHDHAFRPSRSEE